MDRNIKIFEKEQSGKQKLIGYADFLKRPEKGKFFALGLEVCEVIETPNNKTLIVKCEKKVA